VADKTQLDVTIGADGVVRIETHGLKGQACILETKDLEAAVGRVRNREKTAEFYAADVRAKTGVKNR
jgi:hypothetical protein